MADICTCGAQLPPDSLFCHKCGKPQREIETPEIERNVFAAPPAATDAATDAAPLPAPAPEPRPAPMPLNFRNPVAVRIALMAAVGATLLNFLVPILNWPAAGFFAVFLYCRKTGTRLDVSAGVKIGWITGLLTYGFAAIVFAATLIPDALSGKLGATMLEQMKNFSAQDPNMVAQMTHLIQTTQGMVMLVLFALAFLFVFVTCLSMAGGALGAKMVGRS
ncbi:MAG: zinc ribbon domain-containing protein [Bryobacteraceae bacterium]|jgi:hypothetical protein